MFSMAIMSLRSLPVNQLRCSLYNANLRTRLLSSGLTKGEDHLSEASFEKLADETLEKLTDQIDHVLDNSSAGIDSDVSLSSGVLTVNLGNKGTYVINKQTPNKQLWLSSPLSGPKRFDYHLNSWVYKRESISLNEILDKELSQVLNEKIKIKLF